MNYSEPDRITEHETRAEMRVTVLENRLDTLMQDLMRIAATPDGYEMEYCRAIALSALEKLI